MQRDFEQGLSEFKVSISDYQYYVDFEKTIKNINEIKMELNILNSLIGSKNIESEFRNIISKYPEVLKCIPILLAIRNYEINILENEQIYLYSFKKMNYSPEQYIQFMRKIGLFDLFEKRSINNLLDYVLGIEVGLDSHSRKNRAGILMEKLVESYIIKSGFIKEKDYFKKVHLLDVTKKLGINTYLGNLPNKVFDFIVSTPKMLFVIEANFYGSAGGSKLNEIARSYKMLALEIKRILGITFVGITDGQGGNSVKNFLKETFDSLETIYNIRDLERGALQNLFRG